jgi:hypothetical protein
MERNMNAHLLLFMAGLLALGAMGSMFLLAMGALTLVALLYGSAGF